MNLFVENNNLVLSPRTDQFVQQHENLQLIVASQVDQLWQHFVTHSSPVCPHQQTTVATYPWRWKKLWGGHNLLFRPLSSEITRKRIPLLTPHHPRRLDYRAISVGQFLFI